VLVLVIDLHLSRRGDSAQQLQPHDGLRSANIATSRLSIRFSLLARVIVHRASHLGVSAAALRFVAISIVTLPL
jgi:hypothetical protein